MNRTIYAANVVRLLEKMSTVIEGVRTAYRSGDLVSQELFLQAADLDGHRKYLVELATAPLDAEMIKEPT